ncbi:hypothetical protein rosag_05880 [Roseisolibacter agri]|uniref:Uncharacterized protein n=1 Tax=Roseisolibacter agri TaxID=2014610 RepID=A0AA37QD21_9BACT|nr:hypothetical protein rosag_05880 [Roseisolibacter agri]
MLRIGTDLTDRSVWRIGRRRHAERSEASLFKIRSIRNLPNRQQVRRADDVRAQDPRPAAETRNAPPTTEGGGASERSRRGEPARRVSARSAS